VDGVHGTETSLLDLATGRFAERVSAGPLSSGDGFDGTRPWSSDATGMAIVEGNAQARLDSLAWAHFVGRRGPEQPVVSTMRNARGDVVVRLRYPTLSAPIDVTLDKRTGFVSEIEDDSGGEVTRSRYSDYRRVYDVVVPFRQQVTTRFGVARERVRSVEPVATVPDDAFDPPPPPQDAVLDGTTTIPMEMRRGHPMVPIRIDDGPVIQVLFDTGASNAVTPEIARRLHLRVVGDGKAGGFGAGVVSRRYTTAKRLRIGSAELRDQPFAVIPGDNDGIDGTIGCEVMQRFAVRFDFRHGRVELSRDVSAFGITAAPIPMRLSGCEPEIDGALDGMPGALGIDTGDANSLLVMAPFVKAHRLVARYKANELTVSGAVAGIAAGLRAQAKTVRLGPVVVRDVPMELSVMNKGAANDPTELGNVGISILSRFEPVFDYRSNRMWLLP
ncbi:MAG: retroviral-like aspartic protease family protein, partial [Candidatus Eremiobacteraeota bacterium]|nr:retroviral-like aspartic protease family protein [Candidatus Eremiobacteraeota bacterium]